MDVLKSLESIGLPGWVLIIAALVFIARQFGLLDWVFTRLADAQEHSQDRDNQEANFRRLQDSWREDKLSTLLEEDSSFIRDSVSAKMDAHDKQTNDRLNQIDMTLRQVRDTITVVGRELYELRRTLTTKKQDDDTSN